MTARLLLPLLFLAAAAPAAQARGVSCARGGAEVHQRTARVVVVKAPARDGATKVLACWKPTGRRFTLGHEYDEEAGANNVLTVSVHGRRVGVVEAGSTEVKGWRSATLYDVRTRRSVLRDTGCDARGDMSGPDHAYFLRNGGLAYACGAVHLHRTPTSARETLEAAGAYGLTVFKRDGAEWLRWAVVGGGTKEQPAS